MRLASLYLAVHSEIPLRPVGSGKTALTLALCKALRQEYNIGPDCLA